MHKKMDNFTIKEGFLGQKMNALSKEKTIKLKSNTITSNLYISDIGHYPKALNHLRKRKKGANEYIFIYCIEGSGWLELDEKKMQVGPNQFFIIPKKTKHKYGANNKNPWSIYWIHFKGNLAIHLYDKYALRKDKIQTIPYDDDNIRLFNQIYDILDSDYQEARMEFACMSSLVLLNNFIYYEDIKSFKYHIHNNLVDKIKEFLNGNLEQSFKAKEIADNFMYTQPYIFHVFKKATGYPIMYYFNLKKIQKSCEYLSYTYLSIKEISYKLGFKDQFYFSRLFKKYMGGSPKEYRKNCQ